MLYVAALLKNWIWFAVGPFIDAFATMEPKSSVWILAAFGAAISALRGEPTGVINGLTKWIGGMFASVAFVVGVDHFNPEAEAFLVGIVSTEGLRAWGTAFPLLVSRWTGGPNRVA